MAEPIDIKSKRNLNGVYTLSQFPEIEEPVTWSTGIPGLDKHFSPFVSEFCVFTGIPGHGKTTFVQRLVFNLARLHNFRIGMASFENPPVPYVRNAFRQMYIGNYPRGNQMAITAADNWIDERFAFIGPHPGDDEDDTTISLEWVLERAREAVRWHEIKFLVIDPWNELEHRRDPSENETEYTGRAIRLMKRFARANGCAVWVVAHPTKMPTGAKGIQTPNLYDISGSANWYNKCDHGLVVDRPDTESEYVDIHVKKSRFRNSGKPGVINLRFEEQSEDFIATLTHQSDPT